MYGSFDHKLEELRARNAHSQIPLLRARNAHTTYLKNQQCSDTTFFFY